MIFNYMNSMELTLPDSFQEMDDKEISTYYGNQTGIEAGFIEKESETVLAVKLNDRELKKGYVEERIQEYFHFYSRMAPGFVSGEVVAKKEMEHDIALMTFKSNAPTRDLFNIVAVSNLNDKEVFITGSCNMTQAINKIDVFMKIINGIKFTE